jgi:hypothetical protein
MALELWKRSGSSYRNRVSAEEDVDVGEGKPEVELRWCSACLMDCVGCLLGMVRNDIRTWRSVYRLSLSGGQLGKIIGAGYTPTIAPI